MKRSISNSDNNSGKSSVYILAIYGLKTKGTNMQIQFSTLTDTPSLNYNVTLKMLLTVDRTAPPVPARVLGCQLRT